MSRTAEQLTLDGTEEAPFHFVVIAPDGATIDRIEVQNGNWHEAECWAYLASVYDRRRRPEVYAA